MAKPPIRRLHARFSCDLPIEIFSPATQTKLADGRLLDLGMGGGHVSSEYNLRRTIAYEFRLSVGKESLAVLGRVAWSAPTDKRKPRANRYGVSFDMTRSQEFLMRSLLDQVRRGQGPQHDDQKLKDYWSI